MQAAEVSLAEVLCREVEHQTDAMSSLQRLLQMLLLAPGVQGSGVEHRLPVL